MDCSSLLQHIQSTDYSNTTNNTTTEIWLDLDKTSIFEVEYGQQFWFGLAMTGITSIISSYILSYRYYPYFDRKQKLIKLKILNIEPYQRDKILPYLEQNTGCNQDVEGIIFEYANIENVSVNSILDSTLELRSSFKDLCLFILISSLLSASYLQFYWVISHWTDSYRSYIETECYYYDIDSNKTNHKDYFDFQVNIHKLCPDYIEADDYIFDIDNFYDSYYYYDLDNYDIDMTETIDYDSVQPCYVHKDKFTVRASIDSGSDDCCVRCGRIREDGGENCLYRYCCCCCELCVYNGCGYCICIISGLTSLISCVLLMFGKISADTHDKYKIEQKEMTVSSNKDKEYLLTVRESSGEID